MKTVYTKIKPIKYMEFVTDRNIQTHISWNTLLNADMNITTGIPTNIGGNSTNYKIRMANSIATQRISETNYGEWDAILSLMDNDIIHKSDPEIWNHGNNKSWTLATAIVQYDGTVRTDTTMAICRGIQDTGFDITKDEFCKQSMTLKTYVGPDIGFRPVLIIEEKTRNKENPYFTYTQDDTYGNKKFLI